MGEFQTDVKEQLLKVEIEEEEEEVYEKIEAPKWVDLTRPDRSIPLDDGAWFCLKIGCDQKHEQPMDPAALKRSFLLRVMAARSPNVRLEKALRRQSPNVKCPLSAPPKSSKYRIAGISKITTMVSGKIIPEIETDLKVHPVVKLKSTPNNGNLRQNLVSVKALTTPRHKSSSANQETFRSVQNAKVRTLVPRTRTVAKALVFQTPKKEMKKKLEIGSGGENVPRAQFAQSSRCARNDPSCSLPASTPVKSRFRSNKMDQTERLPFSQIRKDSETPSKHRKKRVMRNLERNNGCVLQKDVTGQKKLEQHVRSDDESSDMEIDGNSRNCSLDTAFLSHNSGHCERNEDGDLNGLNSVPEEVAEIKGEDGSIQAPIDDINCRESDEQVVLHFDPIPEEARKEVLHLDPIPEEARKEELDHRSTKENPAPASRPSSMCENEFGNKEPGDQSDRSLKNGPSEKLSSTREKCQAVFTEITSYMSLSNSKEKKSSEKQQGHMPQTPNRKDDDDKENTSASANSNVKNTIHSERKLHKIESCENPHKSKTVQGSSTSATSAQTGKHKIRLTNPKPFRLRTDERGILKEANLERRMQLLSLKEAAAPAFNYPNGNSQRLNGEKIQRIEKSHVQTGQSRIDKKQDANQVAQNKRIQKQKVGPSHELETCTDLKRVTKTSQRQKLEQSKERLAKLRQSKVLQPRLARPRRVIAAVEIHDQKSVREIPAMAEAIAEACEAPKRSSSRGKKWGTIPKEPNFHRINVPKTCTKTPIKEIS